MYPPTKESSGRGLVREGDNIIYLIVSHSITGYKGRDLRLCDSSDTDHYNYRVIAVI